MAKKTNKKVKKETQEQMPTETPVSNNEVKKEEVNEIKENKKEEVQATTPAPAKVTSGLFSSEQKERFAKIEPVAPVKEVATGKKSETEEQPKKKIINKHENDEYTIFVGNLPTSVIQKPIVLNKAFSEFGPIKSLRFRSVAVESSKLAHFDKKLLKKVSVIHNNLADETKCVNAYIVYKDKESVQKALSLNNTILMERHIVVDTIGEKKIDKDVNSRSVFVGNLPFDLDEETLRDFFETTMQSLKSSTTSKHEDMVERVRLIRQKDTRKGKGFGYVTLKSAVYLPLALLLNDKKLQERPIRVKKCLNSPEAVEKQKQIDAAKQGRRKMKGKKFEKKNVKKIVETVKEKEEKKEKKEKGEKKEKKVKKEKGEKKEGVDLSFMGNRSSLNVNSINARKRLMKKIKK